MRRSENNRTGEPGNKKGRNMKMKKISAMILALVLLAGSGLAEFSYEGTIVAGDTLPVQVPYGGKVSDVLVEAGDLVEEGQVLATMRTTFNYAPVEGTITGLYIAEGDATETATERYGASLYIEPTNRYTIKATTDKAYNNSENRYIHLGERVYLKCTADGSHTGTGMVSALTDSGYSIEVTGGEFSLQETVTIYRKSDYSKESVIGRGTVSRATPVAVKGSGSVLKIHVQNGDFVERGEVLFETVEGVLDGLYAPDNQVLSPTKGIVSSIDKNSGESLAKGDTLLKLVPSDSLRVEFLVQEADVFTLQVGQKVRMELYWDTEQGRYYEGEVTRISRIQETTTDSSTTDRKSYKAYASITPDERIRVGMSVVLTVEGTETAETTETADAISVDGD